MANNQTMWKDAVVNQHEGVQHEKVVLGTMDDSLGLPDNAERRNTLAKTTQVIWLITSILEGLIGIRILLKVIAANPEAGFAKFVYGMTDVFLAPFSGLTATPSANGAVLEISSLIAMLVYALLASTAVRIIWVIFDKRIRR